MSQALDIAEAIALELRNSGGFTDVPVVVDRQLDIDAEIAKNLGLATGRAKGAGALVTIFYEGFSNPDNSSANNPVVVRTYQVSIYGTPVMSVGNVPADQLMEDAATVLHLWETSEFVGISEIAVKGGIARPDNDYLIYDLSVEVSSRLSIVP